MSKVAFFSLSLLATSCTSLPSKSLAEAGVQSTVTSKSEARGSSSLEKRVQATLFAVATTSPKSNPRSHKVLSVKGSGTAKLSIDVRLSEPVTEFWVRSLAKKLHRKYGGKSSKRTFIHYYLPGMQIGSGAWATANFNPKLDVLILGGMEAADVATENAGTSGEVTWFDPSVAGGTFSLSINSNGKSASLFQVFHDGSSVSTELPWLRTDEKRGEVFREVGENCLWVLEADGRLVCFYPNSKRKFYDMKPRKLKK